MVAMDVEKIIGNAPQESSILVTVRVRPFNSTELELIEGGSNTTRPAYGSSVTAKQSLRKIVHVLGSNMLVFDPPPGDEDDGPSSHNGMNRYQRALLNKESAKNFRRYKDVKYAFDRVFGEESSQEEVYENTTKGLVDGVLNGYNATVFAYGATGCGKTHTISGTPTNPGIIFLTVRELFDRIHELESDKTVQMSLSYLEVYNEQIRDLLVQPREGVKPNILQLREDAERRIVVVGLSELCPKDVDEVMRAILIGNANRTMSPTEANAVSSRSHAVLQINVRQRPRTADISTDYTLATLSLIDLAGSERASATKNSGKRLLEGANINRSLLALGNCINALCDEKKQGTSHIPYRDSKLTRLLKFSLGGNCKTVMIVCVSPSSLHYEETHSTLKYANRAKNIKTRVSKNTVSVDRHISQYVKIIHDLRTEVAELKRRLSGIQESGYQEAVGRKRVTERVVEEAVKKLRTSYDSSRQAEIETGGHTTRLEFMQMQIEGMQSWLDAFEVTCANVGEDARVGTQGYRGRMDELMAELEVQRSIAVGQLETARQNLAAHQLMVRKIEASVPRDTEQMKTFAMQRELVEIKAENARLRTQNAVQKKVVEEQVGLFKGFMGLNGLALAGLRVAIADVVSNGNDDVFLNKLYIDSIKQFTEATRRSDAIHGSLPDLGHLERRPSPISGPASTIAAKRAYPGGGPTGPSATRFSKTSSDSKVKPGGSQRRKSALVSNTPRRAGLGSPKGKASSSAISSVLKQSGTSVSPSPRQFKARSPKKPVSVPSRFLQPKGSALKINGTEDGALSTIASTSTSTSTNSRSVRSRVTGNASITRATPRATSGATPGATPASKQTSTNPRPNARRKRPAETIFGGSNGRVMTTVEEETEPEDSESSLLTDDRSFSTLDNDDTDLPMEQQGPIQTKTARKTVVTFAAEPTYLGPTHSPDEGMDVDARDTSTSVSVLPPPSQAPVVGILKAAPRLDSDTGFSSDSPLLQVEGRLNSTAGPIRGGASRRQVRRVSIGPMASQLDTYADASDTQRDRRRSPRTLDKHQNITVPKERFRDASVLDRLLGDPKPAESSDPRQQTFAAIDARRSTLLGQLE